MPATLNALFAGVAVSNMVELFSANDAFIDVPAVVVLFSVTEASDVIETVWPLAPEISKPAAVVVPEQTKPVPHVTPPAAFT